MRPLVIASPVEVLLEDNKGNVESTALVYTESGPVAMTKKELLNAIHAKASSFSGKERSDIRSSSKFQSLVNGMFQAEGH